LQPGDHLKFCFTEVIVLLVFRLRLTHPELAPQPIGIVDLALGELRRQHLSFEVLARPGRGISLDTVDCLPKPLLEGVAAKLLFLRPVLPFREGCLLHSLQ
jgi:hypothetical protein